MSEDRQDDSRSVSRRSFIASCGVALGGCLVAPVEAFAGGAPDTCRYPVRITDVTASAEGETLLLRLLGRETDGPVYRLNGAGRVFWELSDGQHDLPSIHREIARHTGLPLERVAAGMERFLEGLTAQGLIYWSTTPLPPHTGP